jgi:hypothetical protein
LSISHTTDLLLGRRSLLQAPIHLAVEGVGLVVDWQEDHTESHAATAESLTEGFASDAVDIAAEIGDQALEELLRAHQLWSDWMRSGRVRKIALVAEKA